MTISSMEGLLKNIELATKSTVTPDVVDRLTGTDFILFYSLLVTAFT